MAANVLHGTDEWGKCTVTRAMQSLRNDGLVTGGIAEGARVLAIAPIFVGRQTR